jgi:CDP-diacylglycerol--glycerol-3-phosphate 3-phosphatidyltransferase
MRGVRSKKRGLWLKIELEPMTLANKITLSRMGLVPVFVLFAAYYGQSVYAGMPSEWLRWAAVGTFVVAATSDGLDGWLARRLNQRTELGVVLDPVADKGLLLAGVLALSFSHWTNALPVWFGVLVVARDMAVLVGVVGVFVLNGKVDLRPRFTGKVATALQMLSLMLCMLQPSWLLHSVVGIAPGEIAEGPRVLDVLVAVTAFFTLVSGFAYLREGIAQAHLRGHGDPC